MIESTNPRGVVEGVDVRIIGPDTFRLTKINNWDPDLRRLTNQNTGTVFILHDQGQGGFHLWHSERSFKASPDQPSEKFKPNETYTRQIGRSEVTCTGTGQKGIQFVQPNVT